MPNHRPLRSLLIGDVDFYPSEFVFGVNQGMTLLGHWHSTVNIRCDVAAIRARLFQVQPDILWGHMLLWSPAGQLHTDTLLEMCAEAKRRWGTRVVIHDGDAREQTRFPHDLSHVIDLVLCNHTVSREAWGARQIRWPYFAFVQTAIAKPVPEFAYELVFAGRVGAGIYTGRTALLQSLAERLGERFLLLAPGHATASTEVLHTLMRTPELAASADAILGYGRPEARGWVDVRTFQYPGAGGVLLSDDTGGYLEPGVHYLPYEAGNVDSVIEALGRAQRVGPWFRLTAFAYVQAHHTSVTRVRQVLRELALE